MAIRVFLLLSFSLVCMSVVRPRNFPVANACSNESGRSKKRDDDEATSGAGEVLINKYLPLGTRQPNHPAVPTTPPLLATGGTRLMPMPQKSSASRSVWLEVLRHHPRSSRPPVSAGWADPRSGRFAASDVTRPSRTRRRGAHIPRAGSSVPFV